MNVWFNLVLRYFRMLFLEMADTISLGWKSNVTSCTHERFLTTTTVRSQVMLQCSEKLKIHATIFTHSVGWMKRIHGIWRVYDIFVISNCSFNIILGMFSMFFPVTINKRWLIILLGIIFALSSQFPFQELLTPIIQQIWRIINSKTKIKQITAVFKLDGIHGVISLIPCNSPLLALSLN